MADIIAEVMAHLPKDAQVTGCSFEGANIIVYTKSREFFLEPGTAIKDIVNIIKKRIELRSDPSITEDMERAEKR